MTRRIQFFVALAVMALTVSHAFAQEIGEIRLSYPVSTERRQAFTPREDPSRIDLKKGWVVYKTYDPKKNEYVDRYARFQAFIPFAEPPELNPVSYSLRSDEFVTKKPERPASEQPTPAQLKRDASLLEVQATCESDSAKVYEEAITKITEDEKTTQESLETKVTELKTAQEGLEMARKELNAANDTGTGVEEAMKKFEEKMRQLDSHRKVMEELHAKVGRFAAEKAELQKNATHHRKKAAALKRRAEELRQPVRNETNSKGQDNKVEKAN